MLNRETKSTLNADTEFFSYIVALDLGDKLCKVAAKSICPLHHSDDFNERILEEYSWKKGVNCQ